MAEHTSTQITLPDRLVSSVDLSRVIRELETVDEFFRQADLRGSAEGPTLGRLSGILEDLAQVNQTDLHSAEQRSQLLSLLHEFKDHAPRLHISLATEPSANFTRKVIIWMRKNISPLALLETGLQPTLAAGCMLRTDNKLFDMSLRHRFTENRPLLVRKISEIGQKAETTAEAEAVSNVTQTTEATPTTEATS